MDMYKKYREFTRVERTGIHKLIAGMCANYDRDFGCLPLNCDCYMFAKWWTGSYCKYFQRAVLPLNPVLQASLLSEAVETRICPVCNGVFMIKGKKTYCSVICAGKVKNKQQRRYMRIRRGKS